MYMNWWVYRISDIAILRWAYKHSREIMRRLPVYRGVVQQLHPKFPDKSEAITNTETRPVDMSAPKITYDADDDAAIDDYHRLNGLSSLFCGLLNIWLIL